MSAAAKLPFQHVVQLFCYPQQQNGHQQQQSGTYHTAEVFTYQKYVLFNAGALIGNLLLDAHRTVFFSIFFAILLGTP